MTEWYGEGLAAGNVHSNAEDSGNAEMVGQKNGLLKKSLARQGWLDTSVIQGSAPEVRDAGRERAVRAAPRVGGR
jgi:hypothetical protein